MANSNNTGRITRRPNNFGGAHPGSSLLLLFSNRNDDLDLEANMKTNPKMTCIWLAVFILLVNGADLAAAQDALPKFVPVPTVSGPIPANETSRPFHAAIDAKTPLDLSAYGYTEEEYFFSGTANVYDWAKNGDVTVHTANAPYATRALVRRPIDPARFSGTVWVEFLNGAYDLEEIWGYSNYYILDHRDAYVGITIFPEAIKNLHKFDPKRYQSMSVANPAPLAQGCVAAGKAYSAEAEPGLRWDMISQAGALLKSNLPGRPLASLKVGRVFLFGQSGGDLPTYMSAFDKLAKLQNGRPVWDGYFLKDSGFAASTNQCDARPAPNDPRRLIRNLGVPLIALFVENISNVLQSDPPDSDEPGNQVRRYDIPGASHQDRAVYPWMPSDEMMVRLGISPRWYESECWPAVGQTDFPVHYFVSGAMQNLDEWVRSGTPPPHAERIKLSGEGTPNPMIQRDQYGNALGGVRHAYVEVPSATYHPSIPKCSGPGYTEPFDLDRMQAIYGTYKNYKEKFNAAVERDVQGRWIPAAYAARIKAGLISMPTEK
jgi:hypothetical protein